MDRRRHKILLPTLLIALLVVAGPTQGADCAQCAPGKTDAVLCEEHKKADKLANKLRGRIKREKDVEKKIALLEEVAALTDAHANAPSKTVAKVLVAALEDKSLVVRAAAARLLGQGQHPTLSRAKLLKAHTKTSHARSKAQDRYMKISLKILDAVMSVGFEASEKERERRAKRLQQLREEQAGHEEFNLEVSTLQAEIGVALSRFHDKETSRAIDVGMIHVAYDAPRLMGRLAAARLTWGTRESVASVVGSFGVYRTRVEAHEKRSIELKSYDASAFYDYGFDVWSALTRFAEHHKLPTPGEWDAYDPVTVAEKWLDEIGDGLPSEKIE